MPSLQVQLLGALRCVRDEREVGPIAAKAIALVAYLASSRTVRTRDDLLGLLWPESSASAARKNLRKALWTIRKTLGDDVVRADADRLAIDDGARVDAWAFEARVGSALSRAEARLADSERAGLESWTAWLRASGLKP